MAMLTGVARNSLPGDFTETINWGDGTITTGGLNVSAGVITVTAPAGGHTYTSACSCAASVTVTDDAPGSVTATAGGTVSVAASDALSDPTFKLATAPEGDAVPAGANGA